MTTSHTRYWDQLAPVDRQHVKPIQGKRYKGTNIKAEYRHLKMTQAFGPAGEGWGWVVESRWREDFPVIIKDDKGNAIRTEERPFVFVQLHVWWKGEDGEKHIVGSQIGGTAIEADADDAYKKAITDALGKCEAALGVCADVYLGDFDQPEGGQRSEAGGRRSEGSKGSPSPRPSPARGEGANAPASRPAAPPVPPAKAEPIDEQYTWAIKQKLGACRTPACVSKLRREMEEALNAGKINGATHQAVVPLFKPRYQALEAGEKASSDGPKLSRTEGVDEDPDGPPDKGFVDGFKILIEQCDHVGAITAQRKRLHHQTLGAATIAACERVCDAAAEAMNQRRSRRDAAYA